MKCFYAPSEDAVGVCKSCGRGLSLEHLTGMDKGIACRNRCESDVQFLITLIDRSVISSNSSNQILKRSSASAYGSGIFLVAVGIIFCIEGLSSPDLIFTLYLGIGFLVYGLWTILRTRRHAAIVAQLPDTGETKE